MKGFLHRILPGVNNYHVYKMIRKIMYLKKVILNITLVSLFHFPIEDH